MKQKRIVNRELLDSYQGEPCEICGSTNLSSGHHIKTKGSFGDDVENNLVCLCFIHHEEIHRSLVKFAEKYPIMRQILLNKGWEFDGRRWLNYSLY